MPPTFLWNRPRCHVSRRSTPTSSTASRRPANQGWLGEVAAIEATMAAAAQKLEAMRERATQPSTVHLGMPDIRRNTERSSADAERSFPSDHKLRG